MASYSGSYKLCATCVYFIAKRDADHYGYRVTECDDKGRCAVHQGPYRNTQKQANFPACSCYQKWPVLR